MSVMVSVKKGLLASAAFVFAGNVYASHALEVRYVGAGPVDGERNLYLVRHGSRPNLHDEVTTPELTRHLKCSSETATQKSEKLAEHYASKILKSIQDEHGHVKLEGVYVAIAQGQKDWSVNFFSVPENYKTIARKIECGDFNDEINRYAESLVTQPQLLREIMRCATEITKEWHFAHQDEFNKLDLKARLTGQLFTALHYELMSQWKVG
jgi:hypothetical protein